MLAQVIDRILKLSDKTIIDASDVADKGGVYTNLGLGFSGPKACSEPMVVRSVASFVRATVATVQAMCDPRPLFITTDAKSAGSSNLGLKLVGPFQPMLNGSGGRHEFIAAPATTGAFHIKESGALSMAMASIDEFIPSLLANFVGDQTRAEIISILSSIRHVDETVYEDDGLSQNVRVKSGVDREKNAVIKNPVTLKAWVGLPGVEAIETEFVLRTTEDGTRAWMVGAYAGWVHDYIEALYRAIFDEFANFGADDMIDRDVFITL
jgi:hypothetical protein